MRDVLSPPLKRALAVAILIGLIGGIYYGVVRPLLDNYNDKRAAIEQMQDNLARYQRAARDLAPRQAELAALKQRQSAQDGFLQGANDTLVAAQIQNRIKSVADATKGELRSTQVLPSQDDGKLRRITVRGQMSTSLTGALRVFHGLESASPLLFIDNVDMRARPAQLRDRTAAVNTDVIDLTFDVYGYTHASN